VHLRPPAFSHGFISFLWGLGLGAFIWLGAMAIGVSKPTAFIFGVLGGAAIALYVRVYGEDLPRSGSGRPR
jgi:hypothetical protein